MTPGDRVVVIGRGLWHSGQAGEVVEVHANGLVGVRFEGLTAVVFFAATQLEVVSREASGDLGAA